MTSPDTTACAASAWYHQSVLWLGIVVFVASIAGCVWLIVVSVRYADTPLNTSQAVFGVPASAHSAARAPPEPPADPNP